MSARTATQAMAEIRLAMGDAVEPLLQVIRSEIAQAAEAAPHWPASQQPAWTEADEHGNDAAMTSGDAVRVLDQVVRDAWKVGWGGTIEEVRNAAHIRNNPAQG